VPDPRIVPRADHRISRRDIDPDALRVLHRLNENGHTAYLVGGSVRDLLLGRRPKDFDIGTSAHPYQIKKLFRNCWIIGRRFRLAHIKFGLKTIEVATFRKNVTDAGPDAAGDEPIDTDAIVVAQSPEPEPEPEPEAHRAALLAIAEHHQSNPFNEKGRRGREDRRAPAPAFHKDNTFGTPEEDAFRRDFTINGLFYDISDFSVIDYVGGLDDLEHRVVRSIGDPRVRFVEDPVRMLRAAVMSARLGFDLDGLVTEAVAEHRDLILKSAPARLMEEYFKILRSGYAEATFRALGRVRLLELMTPELKSPAPSVWDALARLDRYRAQFPDAPATLSNTVLIGSLLVPLGLVNRQPPSSLHGEAPHADRVSFGVLPVARKDMERLRHVVQIAPRLTDPALPPRVARGLPHRPSFVDALTWLEIYGDNPQVVEQWKQQQSHRAPGHDSQASAAPGDRAHGAHAHGGPGTPGDGTPAARRRRRRRRRRGGPRREGAA
jgi:poly(A) polymerase